MNYIQLTYDYSFICQVSRNILEKVNKGRSNPYAYVIEDVAKEKYQFYESSRQIYATFNHLSIM